MNQYLVAYQPAGKTSFFYAVMDWHTIERLLRKNEEAHGHFRIWRLDADNNPKNIRIIHSGDLYWPEYMYGNITD